MYSHKWASAAFACGKVHPFRLACGFGRGRERASADGHVQGSWTKAQFPVSKTSKGRVV